jgi:eukaryotic-like serine/threonine-protein kinase
VSRRIVLALALLAAGPSAPADGPPGVLVNSVGMKLRRVPAGEFWMGSTREEADAALARMKAGKGGAWYQASPPSETPRRRVRLTKAFYLGTHEVRFAEFRQFVTATGYRTDAETDGKGADGLAGGKWSTRPEFNWRNTGLDPDEDLPVTNVSWNDAVAFCDWLTRKEGAAYRLPTEAEWEYACRAGTTTSSFWGDDEARRNDHVWSAANSGGRPHPVGRRRPNAWGLYDMNGNVYEYCSDWFTTGVFTAALLVDPTGPATGTEIVVRSGSWGTDPSHCRSAFRGGASKTHRNRRDGFRVVRVAE